MSTDGKHEHDHKDAPPREKHTDGRYTLDIQSASDMAAESPPPLELDVDSTSESDPISLHGDDEDPAALLSAAQLGPNAPISRESVDPNRPRKLNSHNLVLKDLCDGSANTHTLKKPALAMWLGDETDHSHLWNTCGGTELPLTWHARSESGERMVLFR